jgi:hypothetical protein
VILVPNAGAIFHDGDLDVMNRCRLGSLDGPFARAEAAWEYGFALAFTLRSVVVSGKHGATLVATDSTRLRTPSVRPQSDLARGIIDRREVVLEVGAPHQPLDGMADLARQHAQVQRRADRRDVGLRGTGHGHGVQLR